MSELRERFNRLHQEITAPVAPDVTVIERRGRRRRHSRGIVVGFLLSAVLGGLGLGLGLSLERGQSPNSESQPGASGSASPGGLRGHWASQPGPDWVQHEDPEWGISFMTPESWQVSWGEDRNVAVATYAITSEGWCDTEGSLANLPTSGMFLWMFETSDGSGWDFNGRPVDFEVDPGTLAGYETFGCVDMYRIVFEDADRFFVTYVGFGRDASPELREETMEVLDTIQVVTK